MKFKKEIIIRPAYDKRHSDPCKNYGIHACELLFILKGEKATITFLLYTGWHLPNVTQEFLERFDHTIYKPTPADIGYHSTVPMYEGHEPMDKVCEFIGSPCYTGGSSIDSDEFYDELLKKGSKGVWRKMKEYYRERFEKKK
jgi:hypothetical protein